MTAIAGELDALRIALGEVDVLSILTAATYDEADWMDPDPGAVDAVATLLGLIKKSATAALAAFHRLHGAVADAAPVTTATERWDTEGRGTSPGEDQDAEIVRRIREMCPDNRYDCSDAELIDLFKRNRTVLGRTDEDVIAAMTRPR